MRAPRTEVGDEHSDRAAAHGTGDSRTESGGSQAREQASKRELSYADFLDELLSCEVEAPDSLHATAILDRLLHHSTKINIRGES
jgi:hypothetical protein